LRVIGGVAKKRRLKSPGDLPIRPTADRVKESLFNILAPIIPACTFVDLFAGAGGVGIEALSRGAAKVLFVEKDQRAVRLLKHNIDLAGLHTGAEIMAGDVEQSLRRLTQRNEKFDIVFADPPYRQGLAAAVLNTLARHPVWQPHTTIVLETDAKDVLPENTGTFALWRREKYGDTALSFYRPV